MISNSCPNSDTHWIKQKQTFQCDILINPRKYDQNTVQFIELSGPYFLFPSFFCDLNSYYSFAILLITIYSCCIEMIKNCEKKNVLDIWRKEVNNNVNRIAQAW